MSIYKPGRPNKFDPFSGKGNLPPSRPGEYRTRDAAGELAYIGETSDLRRRMREHCSSGKLPDGGTFEWKQADGRSTSNTRRIHEREKIGQHNPPLNRSKGGEGRPAGH